MSEQSQPNLPVVLAIDPGSAKCGVAVVRSDGVILYQEVIPRATIPEFVAAATERYSPIQIVCGGGTGSRTCMQELQATSNGIPVLSVNESHTTEEARRRYLIAHPAHGWRRLLPIGLRNPDVPVDDLVAVILAERWWRDHPIKTQEK